MIELQDFTTEATVLGTLISDRNAYAEVADIISEDCFTRDSHKVIFGAIKSIAEKGDRPDMLAVMNKVCNKIDAVEFSEIITAHTMDVYQHTAYLYDLSIKRTLCNIFKTAYDDLMSGEDITDVHSNAYQRLGGVFSRTDNSIFTMRQAVEGVVKNVTDNLNGTRKITGSPTGFSYLDQRMGGLQKSDLIIIAAESSQGKTSLAITMANEVAKGGGKIAIYSMEMKKEQIAARLISMESGLAANSILYGKLDSYQLQRLDNGIARVGDLPIYFDDRSTSNIDNILSSIRNLKAKYDIDGVIIDYLQILNVNMKSANIEQQMGDIARRLKNIAKDLDIWVIALSQLSRDKDNPVPTKARLRNSGQIEEASDVVLLIYRPEVYGRDYQGDFASFDTKGTALIDIAKGRNIGIGKFICGFDAATTRFYDLTEIPINTEEQPF